MRKSLAPVKLKDPAAAPTAWYKVQAAQVLLFLLVLTVSSAQAAARPAEGQHVAPWWESALGRRLSAAAGRKLGHSRKDLAGTVGRAREEAGGGAARWGAENVLSSQLQSKHQGMSISSSLISKKLLAATNGTDNSTQFTNSSVASSNSTDGNSYDLPSLASNSSDGNSTETISKQSLNPWYDQHLLSTTGGWGSGIFYGSINSSSKGSLDALGTPDAAPSTQDAPQAAQDPPPYEYPPVGRHPTVYFTAVLLNFASANGLRPEKQVAFSSAINSFLSPSTSSIITNTTVITQALASNGLWLPCATVFFTADSASLQDYLAATLQSDPNLILPTATWGSVRTANIKVAQPAAPASISYSWVVGDYSNCSVMCGGGTQQRQVSCLDNYGNAADASMCSSPAPASSRSCQTQPCLASLPSSFSLVLGPWSACNSTCSYGSRTRAATCVSREGYIGSLSNCNSTPEELSQQLWQPCTLPPCPTFIWSYSDWTCDNTAGCGSGTATRNATCIIASSSHAVNASMCYPSQLDNSTQPCAQGPCIVFFWKAKELADCLPEDFSKPCGRYLQKRGFDCVNMTSGEVITNNYCSGPKPVLGEVECSKPPGVDCSSSSSSSSAEGAAPAAVPITATVTTAPGGSGSAAPTQSSMTANGTNSSSSIGNSGATSGNTGGPGSLSSQQLAVDAADAAATPQQSDVSVSTPAGPPGSTSLVNAPGGAEISSVYSITTTSGDAMSSNAYNSSAGSGPGPAGGSGSSSSSATAGSDSGAGGLAMDISSGNSTVSVDGTSSNSADSVATGSAAGGGSTADGASSSSSGFDLGPGAALPAWLLEDPTPELKAALGCPKGYALSADGKCCSGALIDSKGSCCEARQVDACGICNGSGKAIDSLGACCSGVLDAQGICCTGAVDECGVCNGTSACDFKVELVAAVVPAVLFLVPASNANRRLRAVLQDDVAVAVSTTTGRVLEKTRIAVMLSAYSGQGSASTKSRPASADGTIAASEGPNDSVVADNIDDPGGSASLPHSSVPGSPSIAALPFLGGDNTGSRPAQSDAITQVPEQLDAPTTHANLASQRAPTSGNKNAQRPVAVRERGVRVHREIHGAPPNGQARGDDDHAVQLVRQGNHREAGHATVWRRLLYAWHAVGDLPGLHISRVLTQQQDTATSAGELDSSNAIRVSLVIKAASSGNGADTGSVLQALKTLVGRQLSIPGTRSRLTYKQVVSVVRAGTCGDGICQVNERLSWNNPDSCQADCALPFLSCPPFSTGVPACNGLGVCYNSIGSCACTRGYSGPDCSSCAAGYKQVNGFCVAGIALVPPRMCGSQVCSGNLTDGSLLAVVPPARSMVPGQAAVCAVVLGSMVLVAGAAVLVYRGRWKSLLYMHAQEVAERARMAAD